jgi:hypothetical protein
MKDLLPQLLLIVSPVFIAALAWLSMKASNLINANTKNAYLRGVMLRLNDATMTAVREVQQVYVSTLRSGPLTADQAQKAKGAAVDSLKSHLGAHGLVELSKVLGLDGTAVERLLGAKVEAAVSELKDTTAPITVSPRPMVPAPPR